MRAVGVPLQALEFAQIVLYQTLERNAFLQRARNSTCVRMTLDGSLPADLSTVDLPLPVVRGCPLITGRLASRVGE
jgi:hypothetical protein